MRLSFDVHWEYFERSSAVCLSVSLYQLLMNCITQFPPADLLLWDWMRPNRERARTIGLGHLIVDRLRQWQCRSSHTQNSRVFVLSLITSSSIAVVSLSLLKLICRAYIDIGSERKHTVRRATRCRATAKYVARKDRSVAMCVRKREAECVWTDAIWSIYIGSCVRSLFVIALVAVCSCGCIARWILCIHAHAHTQRICTTIANIMIKDKYYMAKFVLQKHRPIFVQVAGVQFKVASHTEK